MLLRCAISTALRNQAPDEFRVVDRADGAHQPVFGYHVVMLVDGADEPWKFLVTGVDREGLSGRHDNEAVRLSWSEAKAARLLATHFLGAYRYEHRSPMSLLLCHYLGWDRLKRRVDKIMSMLLDLREPVRIQRMELLRHLARRKIDYGERPVGIVQLQLEIYGYRGFRHRSRGRISNLLRLLVDSLVESEDVRAQGADRFEISARGIATLSEFDANEQRHKDDLRIKRALNLLTLALVIVGAGQVFLLLRQSA